MSGPVFLSRQAPSSRLVFADLPLVIHKSSLSLHYSQLHRCTLVDWAWAFFNGAMPSSFRRLAPTVLLVLAFVMALGALIVGFLPARGHHPVLVLSRDLSKGDAFGPEVVRKLEVPDELFPEDALTPQTPLPDTWPSEPVKAGTILSESVLAGSALGRELAPDESLVTLMFDQSPVEAGDVADLWALSGECDQSGCASRRVATNARISSISVKDAPAWDSSTSVRLDLIIKSTQVESLLGYSGAGALSLALSSSHKG